MKIEILVSKESSYFLDYRNEILDPNYVSFVNKKVAYYHKSVISNKSSHSLNMGLNYTIFFVVTVKTFGTISLKIWNQTV